MSDLQLLLACLNIQASDKRGMQRNLNTVADQAEDMGRQQLVKNQEYVRYISHLAGCSVKQMWSLMSHIQADHKLDVTPQLKFSYL
ncbi:hypothetical protein DPMN_114471 [Dreissena polymorpha]|uniref:Uncharacterized protein n=1 Tax=Dreissena polymorpha TaxID=45954 RepID=A0A9D4KJH3_DREPO|nr:hypothetical protein DPMN_114471 [Dreissena polymorpha]